LDGRDPASQRDLGQDREPVAVVVRIGSLVEQLDAELPMGVEGYQVERTRTKERAGRRSRPAGATGNGSRIILYTPCGGGGSPTGGGGASANGRGVISAPRRRPLRRDHVVVQVGATGEQRADRVSRARAGGEEQCRVSTVRPGVDVRADFDQGL